jgi:2-amino-4,5-dihydroxy-6-oxo-7-(phosphonooxy)heptanoate synthase
MSYVDEMLQAPVAGLAMGRNIFQGDDPGALARLVADRVHSPTVAPRRALASTGG